MKKTPRPTRREIRATRAALNVMLRQPDTDRRHEDWPQFSAERDDLPAEPNADLQLTTREGSK